jgi:hypothetical protein
MRGFVMAICWLDFIGYSKYLWLLLFVARGSRLNFFSYLYLTNWADLRFSSRDKDLAIILKPAACLTSSLGIE